MGRSGAGDEVRQVRRDALVEAFQGQAKGILEGRDLAVSRMTTLVNKTGLAINELYVSPSDDDEWGEDILGQDILKNGEKVEIEFARKEKTCKWDLKVIDEDDDPIVWEAIDLCKASEITLKYEGKKPTAIIK